MDKLGGWNWYQGLAVNQHFQTPQKEFFLYVKFGNNCLFQRSFFIFLSGFLIFFTIVVEKNLQIFNNIKKQI